MYVSKLYPVPSGKLLIYVGTLPLWRLIGHLKSRFNFAEQHVRQAVSSSAQILEEFLEGCFVTSGMTLKSETTTEKNQNRCQP